MVTKYHSLVALLSCYNSNQLPEGGLLFKPSGRGSVTTAAVVFVSFLKEPVIRYLKNLELVLDARKMKRATVFYVEGEGHGNV